MRQLKIVKQVTNRETEAVDKYLNEIARHPLLSIDDEIKYAKLSKNGDQVARDKLINCNLRFVVSVAKQYEGRGLSLLDLINEGNSGLIKSVPKFDETRGFKFISYAVWWIRQAILSALAENSRIVRLPLNKINIVNKINRTHSKLYQEFGREPDDFELASFLDIPVDEMQHISRTMVDHVSIDKPVIFDGDEMMIDTLVCEDEFRKPDVNLKKESLYIDVRRVLKNLPPKEAEVIRLYFGLNTEPQMTLEEIGLKFELTRERVRQIKEKALEKLNKRSNRKVLEVHLA